MLLSFKRMKGLKRSLKVDRQEPREQVEHGMVEIDGQAFNLNDWSARAFMLKPCVIDCEITDRVDITFSASFPTGSIVFDSRAIVVRIDKESQELAAYFAMVDDDAQIAITEHFGDGS